jgi:hypothetical protein
VTGERSAASECTHGLMPKAMGTTDNPWTLPLEDVRTVWICRGRFKRSGDDFETEELLLKRSQNDETKQGKSYSASCRVDVNRNGAGFFSTTSEQVCND